MPSEMFCHVIKIKLELFWNSKWWNSKVDSWVYCRLRRYQVYVWFFGVLSIQYWGFYILFIVFSGEQFINRSVNSTLGETKCACIDQLILHTYYIFLISKDDVQFQVVYRQDGNIYTFQAGHWYKTKYLGVDCFISELKPEGKYNSIIQMTCVIYSYCHIRHIYL